MSYSPVVIANNFLDKASQEARAVTPMQLLKLVYIAHGWHLAYFDAPLIDEPVQAWRHGPVIKSLYDRIKHYGSGAVSEPVSAGPFSRAPEGRVDPSIEPLLSRVWKSYARFSGIELSAMTHMEGTPWYHAWHVEGGKKEYFAEIDDAVIQKFYKSKLPQEGYA